MTTRAALLLALRDGPGYGLDLIRRATEHTRGRVRLSAARVYPSLKALQDQRLVTPAVVAPRGRRGARSRTYYSLTPAGEREAAACLDAVTSLAAGTPRRPATGAQKSRMAERIREGIVLSLVAEELAEAGRRARGRG